MKHLFALLFALVSFASAFAGSRDTVVSNVPFDFVVGDKTFAAGKYTISRVSDEPSAGIVIRSADGKTSAVFLAVTADSGNQSGDALLRFRTEGGKHFLTEVVGGLATYSILQKGPRSQMPEPASTINTSVGP